MSSNSSSVGYVRVVDLTNMCIKACVANKQITADERSIIERKSSALRICDYQNPEEIFHRFLILMENSVMASSSTFSSNNWLYFSSYGHDRWRILSDKHKIHTHGSFRKHDFALMWVFLSNIMMFDMEVVLHMMREWRKISLGGNLIREENIASWKVSENLNFTT